MARTGSFAPKDATAALRMTRVAGALAAAWAAAAVACASAERGAPASPSASGWVLTWSDEFEGPAGSLVDATRWDFDVGGHGWGNQELQYYTSRSRNAFLNGEGQLVIQALREDFTGPDGVARAFSSARLKTQGRFEQAYGRFEARLAVPVGQGLWPAFWLLGGDIGSAGWPACGEIDVMETIGREPATVHGTIHGPGYSGAGGLSGAYSLPAGQRFADAFHVFGVEWEPASIRWYVDGRLYHERTPASLAGRRWVFDHPFFLILNVAVGGAWPGDPDATTVFPQTMRVDYVRVYRRG